MVGAGSAVGLWLAMPEPLVVESAARAGPDWVGLDLQHGAWDLERAFRAIQLLDALEMRSLVRVSEQELGLIPRVLDHGASGVIIAMASGADVVREAVRRARYAPEGIRSYGGQRYGLRNEPADVSEVRPAVLPMIEDARGLAVVEVIAAVPGIAGLHVGPVDLGLGLGLGVERSGERFDDALRRILAAGHDAGLPVTIHAVRPERAHEWPAMGFDEVVLTSDIDLLRSAFEAGVAAARGAVAARGAAPPQPKGPYGSRP